MVRTKAAPDKATVINHVGVTNVATGESLFHISTPLGIEPGSLMTGSKGLTHWNSETVCEYSEIAGSPPSVSERGLYIYLTGIERIPPLQLDVICGQSEGTGQMCTERKRIPLLSDRSVWTARQRGWKVTVFLYRVAWQPAEGRRSQCTYGLNIFM